MTLKIRTTLIASAIATLCAGPIWAASDTAKDRAQDPAPTKAEIGQPEGTHPAVTPPAYSIPQSGTRSEGATAGTPLGDNPLYARSADELDGMEVVDSAGDKIGKIKQIVLAPDRKSANAVIAAGGFLGMGAREIMVPLDQLKPLDDNLQINLTKDEIAALKDDAPDMDQYVEVEGDTPISGSIVEFSAFDTGKDEATPAATTPMTPKSDTSKPAATPETPRMPQAAPETPRTPQ